MGPIVLARAATDGARAAPQAAPQATPRVSRRSTDDVAHLAAARRGASARQALSGPTVAPHWAQGRTGGSQRRRGGRARLSIGPATLVYAVSQTSEAQKPASTSEA